MVLEVKIPVIEEGVDQYFISYWFKEDGAQVKKNEDLLEVETDMDAYVIPADEDGVLEIVAQEGTYVKPDSILYIIRTNDN